MMSTVQKAVIISIIAIFICIIAFLITSIIKPISVPFTGTIIKNELAKQFHAYQLSFDKVKTRIRPTKRTLEFYYTSAKVLDFDDNILASAPYVLTEISLSSFFREKIDIKSIELSRPNVSFVRTSGGVINIDIGNTDNGYSGNVLKNILTDITSITSNAETLTELRIVNSDLTLGDEISASLIHAPNANITLSPDPQGVRCSYDFNIFARGEYLHISGECLFNAVSENFNIQVNLDEVRPALLTEISPQFSYFRPLEVRLSGAVKLELDKNLNINKTEFNLTSDKGTLELTDYFGKNININALEFTGKALDNFTHIELDTISINLDNEKVEGNAIFLTNKENLNFKLTSLLAGTSINNLLPQWFSYLETDDLDCISSSPSNSYSQSSLTIDGIYDFNSHQINASGKISCIDQKLAYNGKNINNMQKFMMDGSFNAPILTIIQ